MAFFQYKARDQMGSVVTGTMEAPNREMVGLELGKQGHFPVSIEPASGQGKDGGASDINLNLGQYFSRIKSGELVLFTRQMATLFHAGIPLLGILGALEEQVDNPKFKVVIQDMKQAIEDGLSLSDAIRRHPDVFSELYINMIEAGEKGGIMDEILHRLADLLESQAENEARIKAAMRYPKIVVGLMIAAVVFLMWKVVPVFIKVFEKVDIELPLATRILILVNNLFLEYWYYPVLTFAGLFIIFKQYTATRTGRYQWDRMKLKMPLIGPIILRSSMAKFARVFGNLQRGGVPILDTLDVTSRILGNVVLEEVILSVRSSVQEGLGIAVPLKESGWVPPLVTQMIAVGEESGALEEMLIKVADYYDQEVDRAVKSLSVMIEPILMVFLAALVLFLALAIFLPMWDMTKMVRK